MKSELQHFMEPIASIINFCLSFQIRTWFISYENKTPYPRSQGWVGVGWSKLPMIRSLIGVWWQSLIPSPWRPQTGFSFPWEDGCKIVPAHWPWNWGIVGCPGPQNDQWNGWKIMTLIRTGSADAVNLLDCISLWSGLENEVRIGRISIF